MSLENEYFSLKAEEKQEMKKFKKFQEMDITKMSDEQIEARERGMKRVEESLNELDELLEEVKIELYDFIYNDGKVSKKTIEELCIDLTNDIFFRANKEDYDGEVLVEKRDYLRTLL